MNFDGKFDIKKHGENNKKYITLKTFTIFTIII